MTGFDLIVRNACLVDGESGLDLGIRAGRVATVERGLPLDMHCDESDDPLSRHVKSLAADSSVRSAGQGDRVAPYVHELD